MANNINKESWINEVVESTTGMQRVSPAPGFYERVMDKVAQPKAVTTLPAKHWIAAAILLLALNIGSILYSIGQNKKAANTTVSSLILTEIQSGSTYNY